MVYWRRRNKTFWVIFVMEVFKLIGKAHKSTLYSLIMNNDNFGINLGTGVNVPNAYVLPRDWFYDEYENKAELSYCISEFINVKYKQHELGGPGGILYIYTNYTEEENKNIINFFENLNNTPFTMVIIFCNETN